MPPNPHVGEGLLCPSPNPTPSAYRRCVPPAPRSGPVSIVPPPMFVSSWRHWWMQRAGWRLYERRQQLRVDEARLSEMFVPAVTQCFDCCHHWRHRAYIVICSTASINRLSLCARPIYRRASTLCLRKVPTFKLSVTLSNLNRFSKFLHFCKAYEICYKTPTTLPTSP